MSEVEEGRVAKSDSSDKLYIYLYITRTTAMAANKVSVAEARQHFARLI